MAGIWACASLLHVPRKALADVMRRVFRALRPAGVAYMSFKYGSGERDEAGRHFTDFDEEGMADLVEALPHVSIRELWVDSDVRPDRRDVKWLNVILQASCGLEEG